jgi:hypothetical protein
MSYSAVGDTNSASSDDIPNVDLIANWDGDYASFVNITPQIRLADNGGVFGEWQDFFAGQYFGRKFDFQIKLQSLTANVNAVLNAMTFSVDVPDLSESKTVDVPAGGASFVYETNFHAIPKPQITIFNAEQGDTIVLTNQTLNGFSLQITNNGVGVARTINYFAQKY